MSRRVTRAPTDTSKARGRVDALASLGLSARQPVRFRRSDGTRWHTGVALRREDDGSLGLIDDRGRQRSIPIDEVEVATRGPRGGRTWIPLRTIAESDEQLGLF